MTSISMLSQRTEPAGSDRRRLIIGYLAVLATIPYVAIKIAWVAGSSVGLADVGMVDDGVLFGGNVITLAMDVVAVLVILAFTHSWGRRLPAWLLLLPVWVGTGLLVPIMASFPVEAVAALLAPTEVTLSGPAFLQPWVRPIVYASFTAQGAGIIAAFVLYARARWPLSDYRRVPAASADRTGLVLRFALAGAVALGSVIVVVRGLWAVGIPLGLPQELIDAADFSYDVRNVVSGVLIVIGVDALAALVRRRQGAGIGWLPATAAWLGSGATWSWAAYGLATQVAFGSAPKLGLLPWVNAAELLLGTVMAILGVVIMVRGFRRPDRTRPSAVAR